MGTDQEQVEKPVEETVEKEKETKNDSIRQEYVFASDAKLKECKYCRVMIPKKAKICPNCKMILRKHTFLKVITAAFVLAVIGAGSYCLSAYWGLLPDSAVPAWIAQNKMAVPVVSVTTVETTEAAAGAKTVEPTEVAAVETEELEVAKESGSSKGEQKETTKSVTVNDSAKAEDANEDKAAEKDKSSAEDENGIEDKDNANNQSGAEGDVAEDKSGASDEADSKDKNAVKDKETAEDNSDAEDKTDSEDRNTVKDKDTAEDESDGEDKTDSGNKKAVQNKDAMEKEDAEDEDPTANREDMDENEASFRADCVRRKYKGLLRDKDYLGTAVLVLRAEVICQVDGGLFDENVYYLCMEEENGIECYYIIRDDRSADDTLILEGDIITVYGRLFGTCKLPANLIETRPTVPAISMLTYDLLEE